MNLVKIDKHIYTQSEDKLDRIRRSAAEEPKRHEAAAASRQEQQNDVIFALQVLAFRNS
uniref:Uncharacterized protein n=1 Tax=Physcomitrium patens TaxID=3218 RepID=A0A2K1KE57_PHYPA|nr:hypothetical protein PHYPA_008403 [Physcomitrium patens]